MLIKQPPSQAPIYGPQECPDIQHSVHDGTELARKAFLVYQAANERVVAAEDHLAYVERARDEAHDRYTQACAEALGVR